MVLMRYPAHSKGYVMYGKHPNGGMTETESRNVNFLEDEFPSIGEIKKDLNSRQVTEDGEPIGGNEVRLHLPTPEENQPKKCEKSTCTGSHASKR